MLTTLTELEGTTEGINCEREGPCLCHDGHQGLLTHWGLPKVCYTNCGILGVLPAGSLLLKLKEVKFSYCHPFHRKHS